MSHHGSKLRPLFVAMLACLASIAHGQTLPEVVRHSLEHYPQIQASLAKALAADAEISKASSAHMPQLSLTASSNHYGSGKTPASLGSTSLSPTAKVNLWSGGRIEADTDRARALSRAAHLTSKVTFDDVALLVCEAYFNWAKTADLYQLAVKNMQLHEEVLEDIRIIAQTDSGRRIDLDQASVRLDNARLILQQRKADLAQAMQKMQRFWPDDLDARPVGLDVTMGTEGYFSDLPSSAAEAAESVSDQLPAIAQYVEQVQAAQAALRMAKGLYWPSLDLVTSRQYNTETAKQDFLTQLQLNMPLYSGGSVTAQVKAAEQQLKASELSLEEARLVQREKAVLAWQDWSATRTRAEVGTTQSDIGEKVVQGYRQQFKLAKRSLLDLLNIQADSFGYRSAAVSAFHDERIARARLLASIGQLAARFTPQAALAPSENTPS